MKPGEMQIDLHLSIACPPEALFWMDVVEPSVRQELALWVLLKRLRPEDSDYYSDLINRTLTSNKGEASWAEFLTAE